jgi:hypothetical protein
MTIEIILLAMAKALLVFGGCVLTVFGVYTPSVGMSGGPNYAPRWLMFATGFLLLTIVWLI